MRTIAVIAGLMTFWPSLAAAQDAADKERCKRSFELAQEHEKKNELVEAIAQVAICETTCPEQFAATCAEWRPRIKNATPKVVFRFIGPDGTNTTDVRVSLHDRVLAERLDGTPVALNPGRYTFIFKAATGAPIEQTVTIVAGPGEPQMVTVRIAPHALPAPVVPPSTVPAPPAPTKPPSTSSGGVHWLTWVIGGAGLVGIGVGIGFGLRQSAIGDELEDISDEGVYPERVADFHSAGNIADASWIAGATLVGVAVVVGIITAGSDPEDPPAAGALRLTSDGVALVW